MHHTTQLLSDARAKVTFPLDEMTHLLYDNKEYEDFMMTAQALLENEPEAQNTPDYHNLSREDQALKAFDKLRVCNKHFNLSDTKHMSLAILYFQGTIPGSISYLMSIPAIQYLGTDEQIAAWIPKFMTQEIVACYAQTEIGHGSDVQSLETTATYDAEKGDLVIHTPSTSAVKFWPGDLGYVSNYALVYARLVMAGKSKGVHPFLVQIRDANHKPLPGVTVGDIGPKLGYSTKDNGFLAFNNVRTPLFSMLGRYARIENGHFSRHGNEKVSYASMMLIRKLITWTYPRLAAQSLTIAIRYSICRQQFKNDQGVENSVIEYQTQQDKLLPRLAQLYAMIFVGHKMNQLADDNLKRVHKKDFSLMQQTHALLSASKAWSSQWVNDTIEWCRLSCGGHGYAHYSGLPGLYFECSPNVTLEGENQVLYLQVARYLVKLSSTVEKNPDRVPYYFDYILKAKETLKSESKDLTQMLRLSATLSLWTTLERLKKEISAGHHPQDVINKKIGVQLMEASKRYFEYFTHIVFLENINAAQVQLKPVLTLLSELFALQCLIENPQALIEGGRITPDFFKCLQARKIELLPLVKAQSIGLVDAFKFTDGTLKTLIGCYDGKPYERIYEWTTQNNLMNKMELPQSLHDLMGMMAHSKL